MLDQPKELIEKHIKTHTERSAEDKAAVSTLEFFFVQMDASTHYLHLTINGLTPMERLNMLQTLMYQDDLSKISLFR